MIIIISGKNIEYTRGDTFYLKITTSGGFDENSQIDFVVAENENSVPIIENTYNLNDDNEFEITLSKADAEKFNYNNYLYKLVLHSADGKVMTQKSGDFKVKWGA